MSTKVGEVHIMALENYLESALADFERSPDRIRSIIHWE